MRRGPVLGTALYISIEKFEVCRFLNSFQVIVPRLQCPDSFIQMVKR